MFCSIHPHDHLQLRSRPRRGISAPVARSCSGCLVQCGAFSTVNCRWHVLFAKHLTHGLDHRLDVGALLEGNFSVQCLADDSMDAVDARNQFGHCMTF